MEHEEKVHKEISLEVNYRVARELRVWWSVLIFVCFVCFVVCLFGCFFCLLLIKPTICEMHMKRQFLCTHSTGDMHYGYPSLSILFVLCTYGSIYFF